MTKEAQSTETLMSRMEFVIQQLLTNAEQLNECVKHEAIGQELLELQNQQDQLMNQLVDIDEALNRSQKGSKKGSVAAWNRIQEQLETFENLNSAFIKALSQRQGLIHFEVPTSGPKGAGKKPKKK